MSTQHDWTAQVGVALCSGSRWLSAAALLITLSAFTLAAGLAHPATALLILALIIVLGVVQLYLALRIEFDRVIFQAASGTPAWDAFDAALQGLRWAAHKGERSTTARASGVARLVRASAALLIIQLLLGLLAGALGS